MKIFKIVFNWHQYMAGDEGNEYSYFFEVGKNAPDYPYGKVFHIWEIKSPQYAVKFEDGTQIEIFNPNQVFSRSVKKRS